MSEHDPIDWDELDAETQHELVSLADKLSEESGESGGRTASRREFLGAITAAGLGGSLLSQGADRAFEDFVNPARAGTQSVAQFGEAGEAFDFVAEDIYGPGGQGSGNPVNFESVDTNYPENDYGAPLTVKGVYDAASRGLSLEAKDDGTESPGLSDKAPVRWYTAAGDFLAQIVAHETDNHWSLYTENGAGDPLKRMNIENGAGDVASNLININRFQVITQDGDSVNIEATARGTTAPSSLRLRSGTDPSPDGFRFRYNSGTGRFNLYNEIAGEQLLVVNEGDSTWRWDPNIPSIRYNQIETRGMVWESGSTRPSAPVTGERFFDSSLGQPIWYDGTAWVDAQGSTV